MELQLIQNRIYEIRGLRVMLDFDLAELYQTETKYLKRAVKSNLKRFPIDFMFELNRSEWENLRCSISTSKRGGIRYLPYAFTEQGVSMLSTVLKSDVAIETNISIMRTFVLIRQYQLSHKDLIEKLHELETKYNKQFSDVFEAINYLVKKDKKELIQKERVKIGFKK